jgi:hypothetical protein
LIVILHLLLKYVYGQKEGYKKVNDRERLKKQKKKKETKLLIKENIFK